MTFLLFLESFPFQDPRRKKVFYLVYENSWLSVAPLLALICVCFKILGDKVISKASARKCGEERENFC